MNAPSKGLSCMSKCENCFKGDHFLVEAGTKAANALWVKESLFPGGLKVNLKESWPCVLKEN